MIEVQGADKLARLAKQLKEAGDKGLQRELSQAISKATKPVKAAARQSALATLPKRGGLAEKIANSQMTTQRRSGARAGELRIRAKNKYALGRLNYRGQVRHPVFADPTKTRKEWTWVTQQVVSPATIATVGGWWTKPTKAVAPAVRKEIVAAMDAVAAKAVRGV